jgi:hypothetical protein
VYNDDFGEFLRLHFRQSGATERCCSTYVILDNDAKISLSLQQLLID